MMLIGRILCIRSLSYKFVNRDTLETYIATQSFPFASLHELGKDTAFLDQLIKRAFFRHTSFSEADDPVTALHGFYRVRDEHCRPRLRFISRASPSQKTLTSLIFTIVSRTAR